jgi:hypothetical protein
MPRFLSHIEADTEPAELKKHNFILIKKEEEEV